MVRYKKYVRDESIFGSEKCLKEFRTTCLIWFANALLVQRNTSNMHQKCAFEQFKMHQKCNLTRDSSLFSPESQFWCIFLSEINNHVSNYTFDAFLIVRMRTFGAYSKYFSAPKVRFRSKFNTWFWTPSNTFLHQKWTHRVV